MAGVALLSAQRAARITLVNARLVNSTEVVRCAYFWLLTLIRKRGFRLGDDQRILVVSCLLRGGNSGGPIVDGRGAVVGIVSQQLFKLVAPEENSINESLGMAAATEAQHLKVLTDGNVA
jgi:hypothetical protein